MAMRQRAAVAAGSNVNRLTLLRLWGSGQRAAQRGPAVGGRARLQQLFSYSCRIDSIQLPIANCKGQVHRLNPIGP